LPGIRPDAPRKPILLANCVTWANANVEDPTITISKVPSNLGPISNPGFEKPVVGDNGYDTAPFDSWFVWGGNTYSGMWNITTDQFTNEAYEGSSIAYVEGDNRIADPNGGLAQVLPTNLAANTTYTLTVQVGNPKFGDYTVGNTFPGYRVQLLADGVVLAEDLNSQAVATDTWVTSTVVYNSGATPAQLGQPLEIRLGTAALQTAGTGVDVYVMYDDVQLAVDPPLSAPPGMVTVILTLAVHDVANPTPVEDSMTIAVYDDACMAARIGMGLSADYPGDLDGNCITVFGDFSLMAMTWLDDYSLKKKKNGRLPDSCSR